MLKEISEHFGAIAVIATSCITLATIWCKWRWKIAYAVRDRMMFQADMRRFIRDTEADRNRFLDGYGKDSSKWDKATDDIAKIIDKIDNGLSHKVAILAATQNQITRVETTPIFICNERGENEAVSIGYLRLLGLGFETDDTLMNINWMGATTGELEDAYCKSFERAVEHRTSFNHACDFQHPITGEPRGRWRVLAPCTEVGEALIFTGRFIPVDDLALSIAREHGWMPTSKDK